MDFLEIARRGGCCDYLIGSVGEIMAIPPSIVGKNFETAGAIFQVNGVAGTEIAQEAIVGAERTAPAVTFRGLGAYANHRFHIGGVCRSGVGYQLDILDILRVELRKFLKVVHLATVDIDCRFPLAENLNCSRIVDNHRDTRKHIVGRAGKRQLTTFDISYQCIAFQHRRRTSGFHHHFAQLNRRRG